MESRRLRWSAGTLEKVVVASAGLASLLVFFAWFDGATIWHGDVGQIVGLREFESPGLWLLTVSAAVAISATAALWAPVASRLCCLFSALALITTLAVRDSVFEIINTIDSGDSGDGTGQGISSSMTQAMARPISRVDGNGLERWLNGSATMFLVVVCLSAVVTWRDLAQRRTGKQLTGPADQPTDSIHSSASA